MIDNHFYTYILMTPSCGIPFDTQALVTFLERPENHLLILHVFNDSYALTQISKFDVGGREQSGKSFL